MFVNAAFTAELSRAGSKSFSCDRLFYRYKKYHGRRATKQWISSTTSLSSERSSQQQQQTLVLGSVYEAEHEVKKSRFIGYAKHVSVWNEASDFISEVKQLHPKARHWCYGFRVGGGGGQETLGEPLNERSSDDGEPAGTAGAPILGAIQGEELTNVICIVVRYSGGIKLGAGGLIRAYGTSARQVLREAAPYLGGIKLGAGGLIRAYGTSARQVLREAAPYLVVIPKTTITATVPASHIGALYNAIQSLPGSESTGDETYTMDGSLTLTVSCELDDAEIFRNCLQDATRGKVSFREPSNSE
eukprot:CAMPEP_0198155384 /NCGR_PEP_ID=MMETSP1443-20131203/69106_1 /TAXON_ID=186043 /ORGANISM="Entomoneis sp., Strain CCMP2396" /LENGTH=301 /DNA_ID=CAMNT_0043822131 /DNA_START=102 /DNA_END=1008 /DNA_ORIENTATION=+